ncbi:MAG: hypothetical protein HUK14_10880 [Muribaculaceae bacterium]|nr:hypothetical protein [Muribaculaceae bacterium]MCF0220274.1 hypothetical protein [Muribaculaceae bacterium]
MDGGFLSTGAAKGAGFSGHELVILVPKGASVAFAECFSHYNGFKDTDKEYNFEYDAMSGRLKRIWDGAEKAPSFGSEFEWLGQRGCQFRVLKVENRSKSSSYKRIFVELIGQLK